MTCAYITIILQQQENAALLILDKIDDPRVVNFANLNQKM